MSTPLVSVIVTCFNKGDYIVETINSILAQTYANIEVILIDDGSNDGKTPQVLDSIDNARVKIYKTPNRGVVAARNTAVGYSRGQYLLPVDGDDLLAPTYIEKAVAVLEKDPAIGIVYCDAEKFGAESGKWELEPYSFQNILRTNTIHVSALCRRKDFDKVGGWNPNTEYFLEDWDFFLSLIELGVGVHMIPEVLFYYRILPNSRTRLLEKEKTAKALRQIYLNHLNLYATHYRDPLNMQREIHQLQRIKQEYELVINSPTYRLGKVIIAPLKWLSNLMK